jgi:hypothetical protein
MISFVIARRERSEGRGNPLGAMGAYGECGSVHGSQWIATGYALAMTRWGVRQWTVGGLLALCHCEERAERETRQSTGCNGRVRAMRFVHRLTVDRHGLSPSR